MSEANTTVDFVPEQAKETIHQYGLGLLFAANIFGAGSVYILTETGMLYGFALLWVMPLGLGIGLVMHEMSARLAAVDQPLMTYISSAVGERAGKAFSLGISFIMQFWSVANYALAGAALIYLTPLSNLYVGIIISAALGIALVELRVYSRVEGVIAALVLAIFASYIVITANLGPEVGAVATGFVPGIINEFEYMTMIIALLGTTVYYPNFFIQTSMQHEKSWSDVSRYRKDHTVGLAAVVALSLTVIIAAAIASPDGELTFLAPADPLVDMVGSWVLGAFILAVGAASFTSATGTLFAAGFMVPQSYGISTKFGDVHFRRTVHFLIGLSVLLAIPILAFTGFTPVSLALMMPAVNGVIGLPLTALALFFAVRHYLEPSRLEQAVFATIVVMMFVTSIFTAESLVQSIVNLI
ncbi:NRAMP family divalent metal transporter [Natronolimnohabitans innermongolicus]|uniref:NRAMP family Mn2+ and Fe2+ transporter-like protein n=1 Tax=Natronolimnohabitans innermongolicus JCM 12255 TaxID=1227499 RepID=L9X7F1_9EURY|nr:divalent metal cation transporter [Natronolimnohabitans innermongolicus]ELY57507.1 NRAMP family Mn2+ and Fe2+ transporter-like protein [Natronolimnohabitans innermongolicus JCM 12255]